MTTPHAIYLHIPFCRTKCTYCAFNTYTKLETLIEPFVEALIREIHIVGASQTGLPVHTIFFGGGTPSMLTPEQFQRILQALHTVFDVASDAEISIEANPNDISADYITAIRTTGINRLSLGMQSANDHELKLFARRHDNDELAGAMTAARRAGFDNINLDLIYGIPHQTLDHWEWTLSQMLTLQPDHISLYALGLEEGTPMKEWVDTGRLPMPDDDLAADMYEVATEKLGQSGFSQYEISNWSRPGFMCQHNLQYWRNLPYVGLGPGAHGYADGVRYSMLLSPQRYIKSLQNVQGEYTFPLTPATAESVKVDRGGEIAETLIMGLRLTQEGIHLDTFQKRFGADLLELHQDTVEKYLNYDLLEITQDSLRITQKGRLLSNTVFRELV